MRQSPFFCLFLIVGFCAAVDLPIKSLPSGLSGNVQLEKLRHQQQKAAPAPVINFEPGKTYVYKYSSRQWNGLPRLADQYAGLSLRCNVLIQAFDESRVMMKLVDIDVEQMHTQTLDTDEIRKLNAGKETNQLQLDLYRQQLSKRVRFEIDSTDGRLGRFETELDDQEWSVNIKKSMLSLFQVSKPDSNDVEASKIFKWPGHNNEYLVFEDLFGGICEAQYEITSTNGKQANQVLFEQQEPTTNVTKTINYDNCLTDPSASYDRDAFKVTDQTERGRLFFASSSDDTVNSQQQQQHQRTSNRQVTRQQATNEQNQINSGDQQSPVERFAFVKYQFGKTIVQRVGGRMSSLLTSGAGDDDGVLKSIYAEAKVKYDADGDSLVSDTQQRLELVSIEVASSQKFGAELNDELRKPVTSYESVQFEFNAQKASLLTAYLSGDSATTTSSSSTLKVNNKLFSNSAHLPFALSASWFPMIARSSNRQQERYQSLSLDSSLLADIDTSAGWDTGASGDELAQLSRAIAATLHSVAGDVIAKEGVEGSEKAGEKLVQLVNTIPLLPSEKLVDIYNRIEQQIRQCKSATSGVSCSKDKQEKFKVVRKLFLDALPLSGAKNSVHVTEELVVSEKVTDSEASSLCEAVAGSIRYADTEVIDSLVRIVKQTKSRSVLASCAISAGKLIGESAKHSQVLQRQQQQQQQKWLVPLSGAGKSSLKLVKKLASAASSSSSHAKLFDRDTFNRLVLDSDNLDSYIRIFAALLEKSSDISEQVIFVEALAQMRATRVLPILRPIVADCCQRSDSTKGTSSSSRKCYDEHLRVVTAYSLAHIARLSPFEVEKVLLPVFNNQDESTELRIAAFTTIALAGKPEAHVLERIASEMWREPSGELASFVVSAIDTLSKLNSPEFAEQKVAALRALDSAPRQLLAWTAVKNRSQKAAAKTRLQQYKQQQQQSSKRQLFQSFVTGGDHYDATTDAGLNWNAQLVKPRRGDSSAPSAGYLSFARTENLHWLNKLETGFVASANIEKLIVEYLKESEQRQDLLALALRHLFESRSELVGLYKQVRSSLFATLDAADDDTIAIVSSMDDFFFKRQQPVGADSQRSHNSNNNKHPSDDNDGDDDSSRQVFAKLGSSGAPLGGAEDAKLSVFANMFDQSSYRALDKRQIIELLDELNEKLEQCLAELRRGESVHFVKILMPASMWHVVPSHSGLPLVASNRNPILVSIKLQGTKQIGTGSGQGIDLSRLSVTVEPKILASNYRFLLAVDQASGQVYGVQTEKTKQVAAPLQVSVGRKLNSKSQISIKIRPIVDKKLAYTKDAGKTFVGAVEPSKAPLFAADFNWLGDEKLVRIAGIEGKPTVGASKSRAKLARLALQRQGGADNFASAAKAVLGAEAEKRRVILKELESAFKIEKSLMPRFDGDWTGIEFVVEAKTDDEKIFEALNVSEKKTSADINDVTVDHNDGTNAEYGGDDDDDDDDEQLDQHSKSGPFGYWLHVLDSIISRPAKYFESHIYIRRDLAKQQRKQQKSSINSNYEPVELINIKRKQQNQFERLSKRLNAANDDIYQDRTDTKTTIAEITANDKIAVNAKRFSAEQNNIVW